MKKLFFLGLTLLFYACTHPSEPWTFEYHGDEFSGEALLDLRFLNESFAGEHGFISLSENGESFVRGDGEPIRFWPVNGGGATRRMSDDELAWHARFLAKQGINMNRWHGSINPPGKGTDIFELDTSEVEAIWRFVAAMKKEGIYSTISPFWAHNGHMGGWVPEEWGIEGYSGNDALWGVMYFNDRMKEAYKTWVKYLYTTPNPFTGVALKDEPAVALIQVKNEDGVFFWTMQHIHPELKKLIGKKFHAWASDTYGSAERALSAWDDESMPEDNLAAGILDIYPTWEMTLEQTGGVAKRLADQTEFLAWTQRSFYDEIRQFYREELGCNQLVNPNNWKTADPGRLNDLERYTYLGCEVPAVNRYYAPGHYGENNGWRIDPGHFYQGESCLKHPVELPVNVKQNTGHPFFITESGWNLPHVYQSEAPALIAAYQSLTGFDGFYWFYQTSVSYMEFPYFEHLKDSATGMYPMNRWTYATPGGIAQFPAYALMYRMGYISQGETMVHEVRTLDDLWNREIPIISEESGFDPNRDQLEGADTKSAVTAVNPLAYLTGPVKVTLDGDPDKTFVNDALEELIDADKGTVTSVTGELELNYRNGIFRFETPEAKGISGFTAGHGTFAFDGLTIETGNEYITIGVISMDDRPLSESDKILVQTGTTYRPTGWKQEPSTYETRGDTLEGYTILDTGEMPWLAQPTDVTIELVNPEITRAWMLNTAGYPVRELKLKRKGNRISVRLPDDALYVVLLRE